MYADGGGDAHDSRRAGSGVTADIVLTTMLGLHICVAIVDPRCGVSGRPAQSRPNFFSLETETKRNNETKLNVSFVFPRLLFERLVADPVVTLSAQRLMRREHEDSHPRPHPLHSENIIDMACVSHPQRLPRRLYRCRCRTYSSSTPIQRFPFVCLRE